MKRYNTDPKIIRAKFNSKCSESAREIKKGEEAIYYPLTRKIYHIDSDQAKEYFEYQQDLQNGYNY